MPSIIEISMDMTHPQIVALGAKAPRIRLSAMTSPGIGSDYDLPNPINIQRRDPGFYDNIPGPAVNGSWVDSVTGTQPLQYLAGDMIISPIFHRMAGLLQKGLIKVTLIPPTDSGIAAAEFTPSDILQSHSPALLRTKAKGEGFTNDAAPDGATQTNRFDLSGWHGVFVHSSADEGTNPVFDVEVWVWSGGTIWTLAETVEGVSEARIDIEKEGIVYPRILNVTGDVDPDNVLIECRGYRTY